MEGKERLVLRGVGGLGVGAGSLGHSLNSVLPLQLGDCKYLGLVEVLQREGVCVCVCSFTSKCMHACAHIHTHTHTYSLIFTFHFPFS